MSHRQDQYEHVVFDAVGPNRWFTARTRLGNWFFKVWFADGTFETGHDADEGSVQQKARALATGAAPRRRIVERKGDFARVHASTRSSRYGVISGGVTYKQGGEHDPVRWHRCAHGQPQALCDGCLEWLCSCPGSPKHSCSRAA
jgi:hypothetical protein